MQEAGVHAFDAQQAAGTAEPLPAAVAADGIGEYLTVELPTNGPWPHDPASLVLAAGDGGTWLISLGPAGAQVSALAEPDPGAATPDAVVTGSPSDLVLAFYRRVRPDSLRVKGEAELLARVLAWPNLD